MLNKSFRSINIYKKALDASWMRNKAISNNIANVNTPNYKREDVKFDDILRSYINNSSSSVNMTKTHAMHMDLNNNFNPQIVKMGGTSFREDGNNVNIDIEMMERTKNEIRYNSVTEKVTSTLHNLRTAIKGGK